MKGDVRQERPFSPFLSSPRLASCICHWVARACRLVLAHDMRGGHVGGWQRADDGGGEGSTTGGVAEVEVMQERYDEVGG